MSLNLRTALVLAAMAALLLNLACEQEAPKPAKEPPPLPPEQHRIVSLGPFVTELIYAIGADKQLVGVTDCCDFPPEAKKVTCIGSFNSPSAEKVLALKPTLVIGSSMETPEFMAAMKAAKVKVLETHQNSFSELFDSARAIGAAVGRADAADSLAARMQSELAVIASGYRRLPGQAGPRVFLEIWSDPLTTAGSTAFLQDAVTRAGGLNVAGEITQMYPTVNPEKVVEWDPEVIVLCYMTPPGQAEVRIANRIGWSMISAVKSGRIITDIPPDLLLRPGPRLLNGVRMLADRLNPPPAPPSTLPGGAPKPPPDGPT
jgi:iron complex transport system substrate-binding protein